MRKGIGPREIALVATVAGLVSLAVWSLWRRGGHLVPSPGWVAVALLLVIAALVVVVAWPVRSHVQGRTSRRFDPLRAARALQLAQAAVLTGAGAVGWFVAELFVATRDLAFAAARRSSLADVVAALASVVLVAAGLWAQSMCRLGDDKDRGDEHD